MAFIFFVLARSSGPTDGRTDGRPDGQTQWNIEMLRRI